MNLVRRPKFTHILIKSQNKTKFSNLCEQAKSGNQSVLDYLIDNYNLKVYTDEELKVINKLISLGLDYEEALRRVNES